MDALELVLRAIVGAALVSQGPRMRYGSVFTLAGWLLLLTTGAMLLVPWRWHRAFARRIVPVAVRHLRLLGLASLVLGGLIILALSAGSA